jgi:hypothetical protein
MLIPKEMLRGFGRFAVATPGGRFADGGMVAAAAMPGGGSVRDVNVNFTINAVDAKGIDQLLMERRPMFEWMIQDGLKNGAGMRDSIRRYR